MIVLHSIYMTPATDSEVEFMVAIYQDSIEEHER